MRGIVLFQKYSAVPLVSIGLRLCGLTGLCLLTPILIILAGGSISAADRYRFDPFLATSDLWGADVRDVALESGFTCQMPESSLSATSSDFCSQLRTDETDSAIYMRTTGSTATEVDLSLPKNTLTLGDLILTWGKPEINGFCQTNVISWSTHQVIALVSVPRTKAINYFATVTYISFMRDALPYWEQTLLVGCEGWGRGD